MGVAGRRCVFFWVWGGGGGKGLLSHCMFNITTVVFYWPSPPFTKHRNLNVTNAHQERSISLYHLQVKEVLCN